MDIGTRASEMVEAKIAAKITQHNCTPKDALDHILNDERIIITDWTYGPFPNHRWSAVFDDYDGAPDSNHPMGLGATEEKATQDLIKKQGDVRCLTT